VTAGLILVRDHDNDAYGAALLAPEVGTARMAMVIQGCPGLSIPQKNIYRRTSSSDSTSILDNTPTLHNMAPGSVQERDGKVVYGNCGVTGESGLLIWKNDRFGSWLACRGRGSHRAELYWWDVVSNQGIDETVCAKVDLEALGIGSVAASGQFGC